MTVKLIFIIGYVICYLLVMLSFTFSLDKVKKVHSADLKDIKTEIPNGYILRGICSLVYYFCLIDWMFSLKIVPWTYFSFPELINWIGLSSLVLTTVLYWWIAITLGSNYHGPMKLHENHVLIKRGPYAIVRHPTYVAFPLTHISLFLLTSNFFILISGLLMSLYINHKRIRIEESMLVERFGNEYVEYTKKVGMYLPRIFKK